MKETFPDPSIRQLPPCPLTLQCIQRIDEIDALTVPFASSDTPLHDRQRLEQLSNHLRTCPTCAATAATTRNLRNQQRTVLRELLLTAEMQVPETTAHIMAAISREPSLPIHSQPTLDDTYSEGSLVPLLQPHTAAPHPRFHPFCKFPQLVTAVVAIAVVLASAVLFTHQVGLHSSPDQHSFLSSTTQHTVSISPTLLPPALSADWSSVIIAERSADDSGLVLKNYDPVNGKSQPLLAACCSANTVVDGVAHSGHNLLYHSFDAHHHKTFYHLLTGQTFTLDGQGSSAVWTTDDQFIFAATPQYVLQINVATGTQKILPYALQTTDLAFYRTLPLASSSTQIANFLYFTRSQSKEQFAFYRVNLATGRQDQIATSATSNNFWLDPLGTTVYYTSAIRSALPAMYAAKSDGSTPDSSKSMLRANGTPIGYAADNSLIFIRQEQNVFQLVKLGATPQQDFIILDNLAPDATSLCDGPLATGANPICDSSIALAPYGHTLIVEAGYPSGTHKVWSLALSSQPIKATQLLLPSTATHLQLLGWARFLVGSG